MGKMLVGVGLVVTLMCGGCASIVSKSEYPVTIKSNPSGATVRVKNKRGIEVHECTTPSTTLLSAKSGYFSSASYSFQFEKEGYYPASFSLSGEMDGWYIGNILFGGLIGILIVDPLTGAMWRLDDTVDGDLSPKPELKAPIAAVPASYDQHRRPELERSEVTAPPARAEFAKTEVAPVPAETKLDRGDATAPPAKTAPDKKETTAPSAETKLDIREATAPPARTESAETEVTPVPAETKLDRGDATAPPAAMELPIDFDPTKPSPFGIVHTRFEPAEILRRPGLGQPAVAQTSSSTDLRVLEERDYWLHVATPAGESGWIAKDWVIEGKEPAPAQVPESETIAYEAGRRIASEEEKVQTSQGLKPEAESDKGDIRVAESDDSLDSMLAMVRQKEEEQRRQGEERRRRAELERTEAERIKMRVEQLKNDISKYNQIVSSPSGGDMKGAAWRSLVAKHPEAGERLDIGDTEGLLYLISQGKEGVLPKENQTKAYTKYDLLLYPGPKFSDEITAIMDKGTELVIVEEQDQWCNVRMCDGKTGWVVRRWVEVKP
ncbi:MAG: SH3 domain-containing protein [Thermodesulfobacteriota bacterium]|nr:SH3 domain-containing protein [Thermodesulfobacteriota bacterium]